MTLEEINKTTEYKLPFELISDDPALKIIDCLLSNYEIPQQVIDISESVGVSSEKVQLILKNLCSENIITQKKIQDEYCFIANFTSSKTMGLFQYYRAVLDENLDKLTYNKKNLV